MKRKSLIDRLESYIYYSIDNCWYWIGYLNRHGYGVLHFEKGRYELAHRLSFTIYKGEIPQGLLVCHTCDNPSCINPNHLFVGTHKDNTMDMFNKGRRSNAHLIGERNHKSKLSTSDALEIKNTKQGRGVAPMLANKFGVKRLAIYAIWSGTTWKHLSK